MTPANAGWSEPDGTVGDPADSVVARALAILEENSRDWLDRQQARYPEPEAGHDL